MLARRQFVQIGGGLLLAGSLRSRSAASADAVEIRMQGNADGSKVWFDPIGVLVQPGQTIRWTNHDPGNSHTTTAYHPKNADQVRRIPDGAEPWHSDYLLPNETFALTLTIEGVFDYFCIPHEHAGMVGRIIVGRPAGPGAQPIEAAVPEPARRAFPPIEEIMRRRVVHPA
jgi:plastocyanin